MTLSQSEINEIFELRSKGKSLREIERLTGVHKKKVGEILKNEKTVAKSSDSENKCDGSFFCPDYKPNCEATCKFYLQNKKASEELYKYIRNRKEEMEKRTDSYFAFLEVKKKEINRQKINFYEDYEEKDYEKEDVEY